MKPSISASGIFTRAAAAVLAGSLALTGLTACASLPSDVGGDFHRKFSARYDNRDLQVLATEAFRTPNGEPRWRVVGAIPEEGTGRWAIIMADYARVSRGEWIPVQYPAAPVDYADSLPAARERAKALTGKAKQQGSARQS